MGTGPDPTVGPAVGTFRLSPLGGTHGRIPQHSPARPHAGTPDRAARRDQDPDGRRRVRLRLGVRVRVPVGQSVPVRLISYDGEGPRVIPGPLVVSGRP